MRQCGNYVFAMWKLLSHAFAILNSYCYSPYLSCVPTMQKSIDCNAKQCCRRFRQCRIHAVTALAHLAIKRCGICVITMQKHFATCFDNAVFPVAAAIAIPVLRQCGSSVMQMSTNVARLVHTRTRNMCGRTLSTFNLILYKNSSIYLISMRQCGNHVFAMWKFLSHAFAMLNS